MLKSMWVGFVRQVRRLAVLAVITVLVGTAWSYLTNASYQQDKPTMAMTNTASSDRTPAWGDEMLAGIQNHVLAGLPIRVANACGLGASSCFRCHNGKRAAAPGSDPAKDPWHVHHKTVNYSCAGCHKGNPRLMKQELSHQGMVADPRTQPETSCFTCHKSADAQRQVDDYQKLTKTKGE
jgi:hypothetical protein